MKLFRISARLHLQMRYANEVILKMKNKIQWVLWFGSI